MHSDIVAGPQQYDDAKRAQCEWETVVKTPCSSSQLERQTQARVATNDSSVRRCLPDEDVDIDGPATEESPAARNPELDLFDFRSTDGASSMSDSDIVSFRTDENETYTFTPDESVTMSQSSIVYGTLLKSPYIQKDY